MTKTATAIAPANIAFIKYWGKKNSALNIPFSDTISMNLSNALTTTTVTFDESLSSDEAVVNGQKLVGKELERVNRHLNLIREQAKITTKARIVSQNSFPSSAGIASSASAFAALSLAGSAAAGLSLTIEELSRLARRGSGSAARSMPDGFAIWHTGESDQDSFAETLHPPDYWKLHDIVAIVDQGKKGVGSSEGHDLAPTSPLFQARIASLPSAVQELRSALSARDIEKFGTIIEAEALNMHSVMMTSQPSLFYWKPGTVAVIEALKQLRLNDTHAYFTIDAGANVHVICEATVAEKVTSALRDTAGVIETLDNIPAIGAKLQTNSAHVELLEKERAPAHK